MNWFSNNSRRAKESVLQAVGVHHATEDTAFEKKYNSFKSYISDLERVLESLQIYLDAMDLFHTAQSNISSSFRKLHSNEFQAPSNIETVSLYLISVALV